MHYYIFVSLNGQGAITKSELTAALWQDEGLDWEAKDLKWGQHKINKMELKPGDLQHFHVIKEVPFLGVPCTHQTLSGKSACWTEALWSMHIAWGINMRRSVLSFRATILLESWRLSEMADTTEAFQQRDPGFSGGTGQEDEQKLVFMWENGWNAWSSALGLMMNHLKAYG